MWHKTFDCFVIKNVIMVKNFFKFFSGARRGVCTAAALAGTMVSQTAFAQTEGTDILDAAATSMSSLGVTLGRVVQIALLIAALVTLVMAVINVLKGEREAASKIAWWVIGLALGFAFVSIIVARFGRA